MLGMIGVLGVIGVVLSIAVKIICVQIGCAGGVDDRED